jgi:hypothetical protein
MYSLAAEGDGRTFDDLISNVDASDANWLEVIGLTYSLNQVSFLWMGERVFCVLKVVNEADWNRKRKEGGS